MDIKKYALLLSTIALAGTASAEKRTFIGVSYGIASDGDPANDALNVDGLLSLEFGVKNELQDNFSFSLSAEILFGNSDGSFTDDIGTLSYDVDQFGFMANAKLAYEVAPNLNIYGGVGIGFLNSDGLFIFTDNGGSDFLRGSETIFIYQFIAGLEYQFTENVALFGQFRYLSGEDYDFTSVTAIDDTFVDIGARFYF